VERSRGSEWGTMRCRVWVHTEPVHTTELFRDRDIAPNSPSTTPPSAMLDQQQLKVIETNPIGSGLDAFRAYFTSICEGAKVSSTPDSLERLSREGEAGSQRRGDISRDI
jgi:hypothetical protein